MLIRKVLEDAGLTPEQVESIMSTVGEEVHTCKEENMDIRYGKLKDDKKLLEGELSTANTTIQDLKKIDVEGLQTKIGEYETAIQTLQTTHEAEVKKLTIDNAVAEYLGQYDQKYHKLIKGAIDYDTLELDKNGNIKGLDELKTQMDTDYSDLKIQTEPPVLGGKTPPKKTNPTATKKWKDMSLGERTELFKADPDKARAMMAEN